MRRLFLTVSAAAVLALTPLTILPPGPDHSGIVGTSVAEAQARVSFNLFFSSLGREGRWVRSPNYNYVWVPTRVDRDWAPYVHGHWVHTDRYGWYWVSNEPFAWAVYHYGRWGYDRKIGWFWVPGTKWAPAWVAWRRGDRHVGWAPLPPPGRGYVTNVSININIDIIPTYRWHFVRSDRFLDRQLEGVVVRGDRERDVFERSQPLGAVVIQNNTVVNNVIDVDFIQQETKQEVQTVEVKEVTNPEEAAQSSEQGGAVAAVVEDVAPPAENEQPEEVADVQEVEQTPPPTAGIEAAAAANEESDAAATEECVDTDPNAEGCQPAASGQAEGTVAPEQGEQGAAQAPSEEQTDQGAAQAPSDEQTDQGAAQAPADESAPADEGSASAPSEAPAQTEQGAAEQGQDGDAAGLPAQEDVESGAGGTTAERPSQENCEQDADPQQPGCQPPAQQ